MIFRKNILLLSLFTLTLISFSSGKAFGQNTISCRGVFWTSQHLEKLDYEEIYRVLNFNKEKGRNLSCDLLRTLNEENILNNQISSDMPKYWKWNTGIQVDVSIDLSEGKQFYTLLNEENLTLNFRPHSRDISLVTKRGNVTTRRENWDLLNNLERVWKYNPMQLYDDPDSIPVEDRGQYALGKTGSVTFFEKINLPCREPDTKRESGVSGVAFPAAELLLHCIEN